jgi:hypothetical protein
MEDISNASSKVAKEKWMHFTPQFLDTESKNYEPSQTLIVAKERRQLYAEHKLDQQEATVKIKTNMPITIIPMGDIHWGSIFTNYELFEKHRKTILETPGLYTIFMHNLVDNGIPGKYPNNTLNNGVTPADQFRTMQSYIKELDDKGKVLGAVTSDCHEGWSWSVAGVDASTLLYGYRGRKFPIIENGGILHVKVGKNNAEQYNLGLWHKQGPFNSRFNPEHALRQNRRLYHEGSTDIEIGAHYHNTTVSASYEGARDIQKVVNWIRVGTYKGVASENEKNTVTDRWSVDKFGTSGNPPGATVTLWSNRHTVDNQIDFDTAVEKHLAIRTFALVTEMGLADRLNTLMNSQDFTSVKRRRFK